jgi:hypothetical protein
MLDMIFFYVQYIQGLLGMRTGYYWWESQRKDANRKTEIAVDG